MYNIKVISYNPEKSSFLIEISKDDATLTLEVPHDFDLEDIMNEFDSTIRMEEH